MVIFMDMTFVVLTCMVISEVESFLMHVYGYGNSCDHIHDQLRGLYVHLGFLMYVYMYISLCSLIIKCNGHDHGYGNSLHHKYGDM